MTIGAIGINGTSLLALATKQKAFLAIVGMLVFMAFFPTNFYTTFNQLDIDDRGDKSRGNYAINAG